MRTIDKWIGGIGRQRQSKLACPIWPPDLFAIAGALLKLSGAYIEIFAQESGTRSRFREAHDVGLKWREKIDGMRKPSPSLLTNALPLEVREAWKRIVARRDISIRRIHDDKAVARDLIWLVLIADEACGGIGINVETRDSRFLTLSNSVLISNDLQSFTWDIPSDAIGVLAKQHTPQRGATLRSLTHHLALYVPNDIEARWVGPVTRTDLLMRNGAVNFLLVPWPLVLEAEDFHLASTPKSTGIYFEYNPARAKTTALFKRWLQRAFKEARKHARQIDVVVFPELALSVEEYLQAERVCISNGAMLIAGLRVPGSRSQRGLNFCMLQPTGLFLREGKKPTLREQKLLVEKYRLAQSKHHRWCLDRQQILHYQLAGRIPSAASVWENIVIHRRRLHFLTFGDWMTWSVLVCEDLARQDPAADLIRSVGPNLLIALLMDGPQLRGRWSSRYASVLADDPGTSVLTLTSLGMAERCRPMLLTTGRRAEKNRAIGLWKDVETGEHEIVLDAGDNVCLLTVVPEMKEEVSADGRKDGFKSYYPIFAGYKSFRVAT